MNVTVQELIDSGVHFGCHVSRWNPKMAPYIQARRNLIHIIDLRETVRGLLRARNFLYHMAAEGAQVLWVGTKRQVKGVVRDAGERTGMPVVTERWIGGTLTNFSVIRSRLRRLEELERMEEDGSIKQFSKKMVASLRREKRKIERNLGGVREMSGIPGALLVIDPSREANAVREAKKMGLAVIGILDTDCDPEGIDIIIPGNDDALKSVRLLVENLVSAVEEGAANARESLAAVGSAQRNEDAPVGDEPRPTRGNVPPPRRADETPVAGGSAAAAGAPKPVEAATSAEVASASPSTVDRPAANADAAELNAPATPVKSVEADKD
ncbi:30S ribosomal protein S2 [Engelhardtia mirabilis]|uniref:Small ribosomal subunit protein uS2 n=1 Tax=Engelhardtia mirabilis TaxID=2528011 RepID=A0A518BM73_9BACT|nr:30S ribosomal protein S2 [Planctomycetes bacterium Pla133]QDV02400.1 30S ribosomal protein S2 [Planctomycetes bacterium Pla86]